MYVQSAFHSCINIIQKIICILAEREFLGTKKSPQGGREEKIVHSAPAGVGAETCSWNLLCAKRESPAASSGITEIFLGGQNHFSQGFPGVKSLLLIFY